MDHTFYRRYGKRWIDLILAAVGLLASLPITLPVALGLALANGGQVFFRQSRPGRQGRVFRIYKFKTMTDARGPDGCLLPDADRLTKAGRWVRALSLDELPQLLNVLHGEMSLIGPRPLLVQYMGRYSPEQARRHEVRPGITGWAQVNGRNLVAWPERFGLDIYYVDHLSPRLDLLIIGRTIRNVLTGHGISSTTSATMEEFMGN